MDGTSSFIACSYVISGLSSLRTRDIMKSENINTTLRMFHVSGSAPSLSWALDPHCPSPDFLSPTPCLPEPLERACQLVALKLSQWLQLRGWEPARSHRHQRALPELPFPRLHPLHWPHCVARDTDHRDLDLFAIRSWLGQSPSAQKDECDSC